MNYKDFYVKLGEPYNECKEDLKSKNSFDSDIFREMINSNITYAQWDCFNYLAFENSSKKCNCTANLTDIEKKCILPPGDKQCFFKSYIEYYINSDYETRAEKCPLECNYIDYIITTSLSDIRYLNCRSQIEKNPAIKAQYNGTLTDDALKRTVLETTIYYEDLSYRLIDQKAKTVLGDLVSNIGGLLGLFIGASFLSFAEFFEMLLEIIFICFERNKIRI